MFADPQSVTINAVATSLPRTLAGPSTNVYTAADGNTVLTTKQNVSKTRFRREIRLTQSKIAADPISTLNKEESFSVYLVVDEPRSSVFTDTEIKYVIAALQAYNNSALQDKILGGEF